jgi:hypothetical protein
MKGHEDSHGIAGVFSGTQTRTTSSTANRRHSWAFSSFAEVAKQIFL